MIESKTSPLHLNRLFKIFSGSFIIRISYTILGFVNSVLLAKALGADEYGIYIFALSLVAVLSIPTQFGLPILVIREFAIYHVEKSMGLMRGLSLRAHQFVLISSILVCTTTFIWILKNPASYSVEKKYALLISLLLIPILSFGALRDAMLRGLNHIIKSQLSENLIRPFLLMLGLSFFIFIIKEPITVQGVLVFYVLCSLISFIIGWTLFNKIKPSKLKEVTPIFNTKEWCIAAVPIGLTGAIQVINSQSSVLFLGLISDSEQVSFYRVAALISGLLVIIMQITSLILMTDFARLYQQKKYDSIEKLIRIFFILTLVLSLPLISVFYFYGEWGLSMVYGDEYRVSYKPLLILCIGNFFNTLFAPAFLLLTVSGQQNKVALITIVSLLFSLSLHIILIPKFNVVGAALATSISLIIWNILLWATVKTKTPIKFLL